MNNQRRGSTALNAREGVRNQGNLLVRVKTYSVANTGYTILTRLKGVDESDDNARAGVTNGMTQGNTTTVNVHLGSRDTEDLLGNVDDNRESLVNLEQGDVINCQVSLLQGLGDGESWGGGEVDRVNASVGISW